jgi:hypothetical protein
MRATACCCNRFVVLTLCAASLLVAGCKSSDKNPAGPTDSSGGSVVTTQHGSMSANLDGKRWDAKALLTAVHSAGSITIGGTDALIGTITSVNLSFPDGVGSHAVASAGVTFASVTITNPTSGGPVSSWSSAVGGSSGTITVTSSSATGAAGTFQLSLPGFATTTGTKVATNGVFNVTY